MPIRITTLPTGETRYGDTGEGTEFLDFVYGTDDEATEALRGRGDSDHLFGNAGQDWIYGGADGDHIYGGKGRDILKGGGGSDVFYYEYPRDGWDKIKDFVPGEDLIMLVASGGAGFLSGADALAFNTKTNRLTYDYDGGGGLKPVLIAKLNTDIVIAEDVLFI